MVTYPNNTGVGSHMLRLRYKRRLPSYRWQLAWNGQYLASYKTRAGALKACRILARHYPGCVLREDGDHKFHPFD